MITVVKVKGRRKGTLPRYLLKVGKLHFHISLAEAFRLQRRLDKVLRTL